MNLLLLTDDDFAPSEEGASEAGFEGRRARIAGRRRDHVRRILRSQLGDSLSVGELAGRIGRGRITRLDREWLELDVVLESDPPAMRDVTLVLALPRPPVLSRTVAAATSIGVKRIVLIASRRVERTFWDARAAQPDSLREAMLLGLEQARDTRLPELEFARHFKPFAEDRLPEMLAGLPRSSAFLAHPDAERACPARIETPCALVLGPEGGFLPYELEKLEAAGLQRIGLGERVLRVETAVSVLLSRTL